MNCPYHNKPLRKGRFGLYCPTPTEKDTAGNTTKWCTYKPGQVPVGLPSETLATPRNQPIEEPLDNWQQATKGIKVVNVKEPNWDKIALGKVRCNLVSSLIQKRGLEPITNTDIEQLEGWVRYIMGYKTVEDLTEDEMDRINQEID